MLGAGQAGAWRQGMDPLTAQEAPRWAPCPLQKGPEFRKGTTESPPVAKPCVGVCPSALPRRCTSTSCASRTASHLVLGAGLGVDDR